MKMTDSLKLAEMHKHCTSIEFERQRHLANWLIKSSPHMAAPLPTQLTMTTTTTSAAAAATTTTPGGVTGSSTKESGGGGGSGAVATGSSQQSCAAAGTSTAVNAACNDGNSSIETNTSRSEQQGQSQYHQQHQQQQQQQTKSQISTKPSTDNGHSNGSTNNPVFFLMSSHGGAMHNGSGSGVGTNIAATVTQCPGKQKTQSGRHTAMGGAGGLGHLGHGVEARKPKLRRFNSHDTSSNMFSVADFENARLARRNEIELKQRLARRQRNSANGSFGMGSSGQFDSNGGGIAGNSLNSYGNSSAGLGGGDYSTGDSKASKHSNESQHEPLPAELFLDRYPLPRVVRISYKTKFSDETLQSSSSNGSSTVTSSSSASGDTHAINMPSTGQASNSGTATSSSTASSSVGGGGGVNHNSDNATKNNNCSSSGGGNNLSTKATSQQSITASMNANRNGDERNSGELYLLYRLIRQRHIYHGHNAKNASNNRKKGVLIPQEFPGYFSTLNEKGLPTATLYTSLIQLVRERVYKFVSVDNMPAFTESQSNMNSPPNDGCLPIYATQPPSSNRPQYIKTTARGGQVFRLLAVFEDGKQDHNAITGQLGSNGGGMIGNGGVGVNSGSKSGSYHGREKEKGRYAQLINENRQVLYVPLSTKGKFYEIEPGVPQILQKLHSANPDAHKKINPECVYRITALVSPNKGLPLTLRYISGPSGCANAIPENICISKITTENVVIACPIEDVEVQSPLHLRKLHLTKEMNLMKSYLGFDSEQRMLANPNVQNILKYCQFNCDQFLRLVEIEVLNRAERSGSKSRVDGLKILKPLHLPKLLRREKTTISAHEKEDSIIFLSKTDLANLEAKEAAGASTAAAGSDQQSNATNRITDKMKVFQTTKKKWFKKHDKQSETSLASLELDVQAKRMSMERYTDMSKLLQDRFGDKSNTPSQEQESISEPSGASDLGCSDTETTTLATIEQKMPKSNKSLDILLQKSMSLQDIELISGHRKPDLLDTHNNTADTISETGTELDDLENQEPAQSFITEKLYNEFHVKTRQYSKSSSSLHQLLNFSLPQKMQLHDREIERDKRSLAKLKASANKQQAEKRLDGSEMNGIGSSEPITGRRAAGGLSLLSGSFQPQLTTQPSPASLIEDELPYSSVRDSLVLSSDESPLDEEGSNICQALNMIDYTKENIYAEICHEASVMGGIPSSETHSTQISNGPTISSNGDDDFGDYASLCYPVTNSGAGGNAISRVQVNCSPSPISYQTVYFGDEPLGERHDGQRRSGRRKERDRTHVTTVELAGSTASNGNGDFQSFDNIYNTLK